MTNGREIYKGYLDRHKELLLLPGIGELIERYGRGYIEGILYCLELVYDVKSKFYRMPYRDKVDYVSGLVMGDNGELRGFIRDNISFVNEVERIYDTIELKYLRNWEKKLEERIDFLERTEFNLVNAKLIDEIMLRSSEILEQKRVIRNLIIEEKKRKIKGGDKLSLLAEGKLGYEEVK